MSGFSMCNGGRKKEIEQNTICFASLWPPGSRIPCVYHTCILAYRDCLTCFLRPRQVNACDLGWKAGAGQSLYGLQPLLGQVSHSIIQSLNAGSSVANRPAGKSYAIDTRHSGTLRPGVARHYVVNMAYLQMPASIVCRGHPSNYKTKKRLEGNRHTCTLTCVTAVYTQDTRRLSCANACIQRNTP